MINSSLIPVSLYFNPRSHERSDINALCIINNNWISIHAPTRGATLSAFFGIYYCFKFQSTLPREERLILISDFIAMHKFQSTLPREERRSVRHFDGIEPLFQSTLPREERLNSLECVGFPNNFNPRSHERSDSKQYDFKFNTENFNPRSHERSDPSPVSLVVTSIISIHAPTRGATNIIFIGGIKSIFQSTLPREERRFWG